MARFVWRLWGGAARDRGLYSSSLILWRHQTYTGIWNPGPGQKLVFSSSYTCVGNDHHTRVCVYSNVNRQINCHSENTCQPFSVKQYVPLDIVYNFL